MVFGIFTESHSHLILKRTPKEAPYPLAVTPHFLLHHLDLESAVPILSLDLPIFKTFYINRVYNTWSL